MKGQVVTISFEDGAEASGAVCGLEDCECPDHEGTRLPGTYVTVRLDDPEEPVLLGRVVIEAEA